MDAELPWFFNDAELELGMPSNFLPLLTGVSSASREAVDRRCDAVRQACERVRGGGPSDAPHTHTHAPRVTP
jgi:hypothetical protein